MDIIIFFLTQTHLVDIENQPNFLIHYLVITVPPEICLH